ncbi:MAG: CoB--CoM heterodisulfide reductase iron-sulfur subunit B family protein [Defluviitaleaceae bacterium]|nr:CoB--CoM heterodisulfide reductase iron-sulfur subunit B family protein [Defluviitaleaceae bacterium]
MKFYYYPGCTLSTKAKELDICARLSAQALGIELVEIENWQCCGAVYPLGTDVIAQKLPSIRALKTAAQANIPLVTMCSACHHVLKRVNNDAIVSKEFRDTIARFDPDLAYDGSAKVLHYFEVLRDYVGFDKIREKIVNPMTSVKIGAYYGCMLLRPSGVMAFDDAENPTIIEDFINAIGATPIKYAMRNECCGGYISLAQPEKAAKMCNNILANVQSSGAEMLITACPLCAYNVGKQSNVNIEYFTKILAQALGLEVEQNA